MESTMANVQIPLTFQIYKGSQPIRTEKLTQGAIKVGKLASCHLRIDDEAVSRMHAVIEITAPDQIHVVDLGSRSGTFLNGRKIQKEELRSGDELKLGDTRV